MLPVNVRCMICCLHIRTPTIAERQAHLLCCGPALQSLDAQRITRLVVQHVSEVQDLRAGGGAECLHLPPLHQHHWIAGNTRSRPEALHSWY